MVPSPLKDQVALAVRTKTEAETGWRKEGKSVLLPSPGGKVTYLWVRDIPIHLGVRRDICYSKRC